MHQLFPGKQLKNLYNTFIKLCTGYGILAWGEFPRSHLNKVSGSLKKAVKVLMLKNKYESTRHLFEYLRIVRFDVNIKLQQLPNDLQPASITKHFPFIYIETISNTNSDTTTRPQWESRWESLSGFQVME